jgi:hypothetical protein
MSCQVKLARVLDVGERAREGCSKKKTVLKSQAELKGMLSSADLAPHLQ